MTTWGRVHVGDTVRGADARAWAVVGRGRPRRFALAGDEATFALRLGEREVKAARRLADAVDLIERADHTDTAAAVAALIDTGLTIDIIEESTVPDPKADPFISATQEVKIKNGRYELPDPETGKLRLWTRVSTIAKTISDEFMLARWGERMVAKGVALRPDLIAGAAAADPVEDKSTLDSIAKQAKDFAKSRAGANFGTALHSFIQRLDQGEPVAGLGAPEPLDRDIAAYASLMKAARLNVRRQYVERVVLLPDFNVAGRFDRLVERSGESALTMFDLKSADKIEYSWLANSIQLALYAHASLMWNPAAGSYEPMPSIDRARALVLHLPVGKAQAQLYGVNLVKGWQHVQTAMDVRAARSGAKDLAWLIQPDDPRVVALHNVSRAGSREELAALWESLNKRGLWSQEVNAAAMARHAELQALVNV